MRLTKPWLKCAAAAVRVVAHEWEGSASRVGGGNRQQRGHVCDRASTRRGAASRRRLGSIYQEFVKNEARNEKEMAIENTWNFLIVIAAVAILVLVVKHLWNCLSRQLSAGMRLTFGRQWASAARKILSAASVGRGGCNCGTAWRTMGEDVPEEREKFDSRHVLPLRLSRLPTEDRRPRNLMKFDAPAIAMRIVEDLERENTGSGSWWPNFCEKRTAPASPGVDYPFGICCRQREIVAILGLL